MHFPQVKISSELYECVCKVIWHVDFRSPLTIIAHMPLEKKQLIT